MPVTTIKDLNEALDLGLGIVTRVAEYKTKDWVSRIFPADIDGDGKAEIIVCSRDGRIHVLEIQGSDVSLRWNRIIGSKAWVGTAAVCWGEEEGISRRIVVGTQDGKVFVLDKDGRTVSRQGELFSYNKDGIALDREREIATYWYDTGGHAIRQIAFDAQSGLILIGAEDCCVYALDYRTGELRWKFQANGRVRSVFIYDVNGDGRTEILVGSADRSLYLLDQQGYLFDRYDLPAPIYNCQASDIDNDGFTELLVSTEDKDLVALTYRASLENGSGIIEPKWRKTFQNRLLAFCVADVDGDGHTEIIAACEDKHIYILDDQGTYLWRHNHRYRAFTVYPWDIDGNGLPEILLGTEHNRVRVMRIRQSRETEKKIQHHYRQLKRTLPVPPGLTAEQEALLQDILRLGQREMVTLQQGQAALSNGDSARALSIFLKLEQQKVERRWCKPGLGKIRALCLRHTADEQEREILVGTAEGSIHALQGNGRALWSLPLNNQSEQIAEMQTGFLDQQKQESIVVRSAKYRVYTASGTKKPRLRDMAIPDSGIASLCITAPDRHASSEIILGLQNRELVLYHGNPFEVSDTIKVEEGIRYVRAHASGQEGDPEIFVASLGNQIIALARGGRRLWTYQTRDRISVLFVRDINKDGKVEVLVGSEDRNIHVLDSAGKLLWRYYLPHTILAIDVADSDGKIFVGCADGLLYVFSREGDVLWNFEASDRIRALSVGDIDSDGNLEVVLGAEDKLELLCVVNQRQVSILIDRCWSALQQAATARRTIQQLLAGSDPFLQAFAINRLVEQEDCTWEDLTRLEPLFKAGAPEVRRALARAVLILYPLSPSHLRHLLAQLWIESGQDAREVIINNIHLLLKYDRELGFDYLRRAFGKFDRFGRRKVMRILYQILDVAVEKPIEELDTIFRLLLSAIRDTDSEWVRQEGARTLGRFLDLHYGSLIIYVHLFIVKGVSPTILHHIAHTTTVPVVRRLLHAVMPMLSGLDERNAGERLREVVRALDGAANLIYGKDSLQLYTELQTLFALETLAEIATYQCRIKKSQLDSENRVAPLVIEIFERLGLISRPLKMYVRRENVHDRLTSLLEAIEAISQLQSDVEETYKTVLMDEPITALPDHAVLTLLLGKWRRLVVSQLNELSGKAEISADFQPRMAHHEGQISIWFSVKNTGRSSASDLKITLLHSDLFAIVGTNTFETEVLLPQEELVREFTLRPYRRSMNLLFEVTFDDIDGQTKIENFEDILTLREALRTFREIPNPYSSGVPVLDSKMFYGREKDMDFLRKNLTREARSVIVLYGQRRSGKTTILQQLQQAQDLGEAIPVLIDMQGISYEMTIASFLHSLANSIAEEMEQKGLCIGAPELGSFEVHPVQVFNQFLNKVERQLAGRKLILLIDEFEVLEEQVNKRKLQPEVFEYLRDIVQYRQHINFLFAGTHKITEHTKWYRSVFFNIAIHYPLSHLTDSGAEALIQEPVAGFLDYEPHAVKKIHQLTGDQAYLIHLMCRAIVDYCNEQGKTFVTLNDVNTVLNDVMQTGRFHFDWLWDQIKPDVRVALAAIAEGGKEEGRWLGFSELKEVYRRHHLVFKREYILDALKTLQEADIIEKTRGDASRDTLETSRFRIPVGLTRNWLQKEHPLDLMTMELTD